MDMDPLDAVSPENRDTIKRYREFSQLMRGTHGELLAVQLLLEATIEDCLRVMLPNPDAILSRDMSFSNKLALMESLFQPAPRRQAVFATIRVLNTARNVIAHGGTLGECEKAIQRVRNLATSRLQFSDYDDEDLATRLTAIAIKCCGYMLGLVEGTTGVKPDSQITIED